MSRILDRKAFKYTPAAHTDIRLTFKRIRAEQKKAEEFRKHVVTSIARKRA